MSGFSDDGQWWWDGATWVATSQVVLPTLPATEFERSGRLQEVNKRMRSAGWLAVANEGCLVQPITAITGIALLNILQPSLRAYRTWRLEQLELATSYLLGSGEPMLAGEPANATSGGDGPFLAVVVTAAHVLVFRLDAPEGQPRWIALAGRPGEVKIEHMSVAMGLLYTALIVTSGNARFEIRGWPGVFKPEPVLDAWRRAVTATASAR